MSELLNCPFCNFDEAKIYEDSNCDNARDWTATVSCERCCCDGPRGCSKEDAAALWNRRAPTPPAPQPMTDEQIREIFMAHGFTVKDGQADLKPYVYAAARALLAAQEGK